MTLGGTQGPFSTIPSFIHDKLQYLACDHTDRLDLKMLLLITYLEYPLEMRGSSFKCLLILYFVGRTVTSVVRDMKTTVSDFRNNTVNVRK